MDVLTRKIQLLITISVLLYGCSFIVTSSPILDEKTLLSNLSDCDTIKCTDAERGDILNKLGYLYLNVKNDFPKAKQYLEKAVIYTEKVYGRNSVNMAVTLDNLGLAYWGIGKYSEAYRFHSEACSIFSKIYTLKLDYAMCLNNKASSLEGMGELSKAMSTYDEALKIFDSIGLKPSDWRYKNLTGNMEQCKAKIEINAHIRQSDEAIYVSTPNTPWELRFPKSGWELMLSRRREDGQALYYMFSNLKTKMAASFFIEPVEKCKTSTDCRKLFWDNPGPGYKNPQSVKQFEENGFAIVKCVLTDFDEGQETKSLNYSAHIVREGYWVDMHLSISSSKEHAETLLTDFLRSVSFQQK